MGKLVAKFSHEDRAAVSAAEEESVPSWYPDDLYVSQVLFEVISSRSA